MKMSGGKRFPHSSQIAGLDLEADLVAVGRSLLVDPQWVKKIQEGRLDELIPFMKEATNVLS